MALLSAFVLFAIGLGAGTHHVPAAPVAMVGGFALGGVHALHAASGGRRPKAHHPGPGGGGSPPR